MQQLARDRLTRPSWLWALLPLLLATALAGSLLDRDAFNGDEPNSLVAAGVRSSSPLSVAEILDDLHPNQAQGWPLLLSVWARVVGWSEPAIRSLSLFAGMLALAWVYRTGRDLLAPQVGLYAALLMSASVFFLTYVAHARVFALVALFTTLCLWCYWRIVRRPQPPGIGAQTGLLLGATGLLWAHYICALFLPALGLYHLLFAPKTRRWWRPTLLLILAATLATPQLPGLLRGLDMVVTHDTLPERALSATALILRLVHSATNSPFNPRFSLGELATLVLTFALVMVTGKFLRLRYRDAAVRLVLFVSATQLVLLLTINEVLPLVTDTRIRYLMPLWPMLALLAGAGFQQLAGTQGRLAARLLAIWLLTGAVLTLATGGYRYELGYFWHSGFHQVQRKMLELVPADGLVAIDRSLEDNPMLYRSTTTIRMLDTPYRTVFSRMDERLADIMPLHANEPSIWLLYNSSHSIADQSTIERDGRLERILCERVQEQTLDRWELRLDRYVLPPGADCPDSPVRLAFEAGIRMIEPEITIADGVLRLDAHFHSEDHALLANYSLALHVIDPRTDQRVAQGDVGVGPGYIASLRSEIDISALPAGEYELRIGLYNWQTGERLPARDLATSASGDMHSLQRFHLG